jgi:hypothetical protein
MIDYIIYRTATGDILASGSCAEAEIKHYISADTTIITGVRLDDVLSAYVDTAGALQPLPPRPNWWMTWDRDARSWVDPRPLAELAAEAWKAIKAKRDAVEMSPFAYQGHEYDGDADTQRRIAIYAEAGRAAVAAGLPFSIDFAAADDTLVTLTADDFAEMLATKAAQINAAFVEARRLRAKIKAATSAADLAKIKWSPSVKGMAKTTTKTA